MTKNKKSLIIPSIDAMCAELGFTKVHKYHRYDRPFGEEFTDSLSFGYSYFGSKEYIYVNMLYGVDNKLLVDLNNKLHEYRGVNIASMIRINAWNWKGTDKKDFFWNVTANTDINSVIAEIKTNIITRGYEFFDKYHDWDYLCEMIITGKVPCIDTPGYGACALYLNGKKQEAIDYYEGRIKMAKEKFEKLGRKLREEEYQPFRDNLKKLP